MEQFTASDRREERFLQLLSEGHPDDRLYVYWAPNGKIFTPAILISHLPFDNLYEFLRERYGGQWYIGMIRRRKTMLIRHAFGIAQPLNFTPRKDIRLEIERLRRAERRRIKERG